MRVRGQRKHILNEIVADSRAGRLSAQEESVRTGIPALSASLPRQEKGTSKE